MEESILNDDVVETIDVPFTNEILKEKRRKHIKSKIQHQKKLAKQVKDIKWYPEPAYAINKNREHVNDLDQAVTYKKNYKSSHAFRFKYYKKLSNRKVRQRYKFIERNDDIYFHADWMNEEYMELYCDEYGDEWDITSITDIDEKLDLGRAKGMYKKVFDYANAVD